MGMQFSSKIINDINGREKEAFPPNDFIDKFLKRNYTGT